MEKLMFVCLLSCTQDVSIVKRYDETPYDSAVVPDTLDPWVDPSTGVAESENSSEPAGGDTPSQTQEPSDEDLSRTIGFAELHFTQIACPACVGVGNEFDIYAKLKLHQPTGGDYTEWLTPVGTCAGQLIESYVASTPLAATQGATFNNIVLNPAGPGEWLEENIYEFQVPRRTMLSVTTEHGVAHNAFETLEGFDSIEPYTLLWVDPSYAFEAPISRNYPTQFSWYPSVQGEMFEIMVAVYSPDGAQLLGVVSCMEYDIGSMSIPNSYFQSYPYWSLAAVYLSRHSVQKTVAPELGGIIESHQTWTVIGTGHIE